MHTCTNISIKSIEYLLEYIMKGTLDLCCNIIKMLFEILYWWQMVIQCLYWNHTRVHEIFEFEKIYYIVLTQDISWTYWLAHAQSPFKKCESWKCKKKSRYLNQNRYVPNHFLEDPKMALLKLQSWWECKNWKCRIMYPRPILK